MVSVHRIPDKEEVNKGEIIKEDKAVFKIHSSDIEFKKSEYEYIKIQ
tara:strand:+ start:3351 stop:3491 length:141 start_codon:yes stop_codon:yes gene_type:complete